MPRYNTDKIIYAVGVVKTSSGFGEMLGATDGNLQYATVQRKDLSGHVSYEVVSRSGDVLNVDSDAIDALINALIKARNPI